MRPVIVSPAQALADLLNDPLTELGRVLQAFGGADLCLGAAAPGRHAQAPRLPR